MIFLSIMDKMWQFLCDDSKKKKKKFEEIYLFPFSLDENIS